MSTLLPGTAKRYLQPSPQEPSLQLWRLSFPQAGTATKATLATHAALFPSASLVESPRKLQMRAKGLCVSLLLPQELCTREPVVRDAGGFVCLCPQLPVPFPSGPLPLKHSSTPHMTVQGEENLPPELCGEQGSLLVLGPGDTTTMAQPGRTWWVDGRGAQWQSPALLGVPTSISNPSQAAGR